MEKDILFVLSIKVINKNLKEYKNNKLFSNSPHLNNSVVYTKSLCSLKKLAQFNLPLLSLTLSSFFFYIS